MVFAGRESTCERPRARQHTVAPQRHAALVLWWGQWLRLQSGRVAPGEAKLSDAERRNAIAIVGRKLTMGLGELGDRLRAGDRPEDFAADVKWMAEQPQKFFMVKQGISFHSSQKDSYEDFHYGPKSKKAGYHGAMDQGQISEHGFNYMLDCVIAMKEALGDKVSLALDCGPGWFLNDARHDRLEPSNPVIRDFSKFPEIRFLSTYFFVPPLLLAVALPTVHRLAVDRRAVADALGVAAREPQRAG